MKNILLPIDLYDDSRRVLQEVLTFLHGVEGNSKVILLTTYMVPASVSGQIINTYDALRNQSLEKLKKELHAAKELSTDVKISFETISQMGAPANVISRLMKEKNIDCVIVEKWGNGTDGGPKQEAIIRLLNHLHCPMVVLPFSPIEKRGVL